MRFLRTRLGLLLLLPLLLIVGCEPDDLPTMMVPPESGLEYAEVPVVIDVAMGSAGTKAPVLAGSDDARRGGALFLVFRSATGQLDSYRYFTPAELADAASNPLSLRVPLVECDFYVLGNLMAVHRSTGAAANLMDALGADFPVDEATLEALAYRLDGGAINASWRRETMDEVRQYGIPFGCVERNVQVRNLISQGKSIPQTTPVWFFSKVVVKINHGTFDGGDPTKVDYFTNKTFRIRQANLKLMPFSDGSVKAEEAADTGDGDRDPAMTNASAGEFVFFVPENMQGTAPDSAFDAEPDAGKKSRLKVPSNTGIPAACRDYGSYVEFTGTLDKSAGGFGGDVTYQFYLGANETTDFNLRRGRQYNIQLCFTADGLFHPDWRVQPSLTDSRLFRLTADPSFSTDIGDVNASRMLAVRQSRAGAFYLYMNPVGTMGGANLLKDKVPVPPAEFSMTSLSDCAWYGSFMISGTADAQWLSERGITASWDKADARLMFSVTDASKFNSHLGESREFIVSLLPGGTLEQEFTLKLETDFVVTVGGGSLTDEFYLGQKRTVSVSGFSGSTVKYAAVQPATGNKAAGNVQWKTTSDTGAFPGCKYDSNGNPVLRVSENEYASQSYTPGSALNVYAWYPNKFQPSHGWTSRDGTIVFFSDDWLNDSFEVPVTVSEPYLKTYSPSNTVYLPLDGTPWSIPEYFGYMTFDGSSQMSASAFDATLYDKLLKFKTSSVNPGSWLDGINVDVENLRIYCADTAPSSGNLESLGFNPRGYYYPDTNHTVYATVNTATGLWSDRAFSCKVGLSTLVIDSFGSDGLTYDSAEKVVIRTDYFSPGYNNGLNNENPFTSNGSFSVWVEYHFENSDFASVEFISSGKANTYTSRGVTYEPVMNVVMVTKDTGLGGIARWIYNEEDQVMTGAGGEPIPGGLIVPYGKQAVQATFKNRWDGRSITIESGKTVDIQHYLTFGYFVGATQQQYARVYCLPCKNVKYLISCSKQATKEQRTWMTKLFGARPWVDKLKISQAYCYGSGSGDFYKKYTPSVGLPLTDFSPEYLPSPKSQWSDAAIAQLNDNVSPNLARMVVVDSYYGEYNDDQNNSVEGFVPSASFYVVSNTSGNWAAWATNGTMSGSVRGVYVNTSEAFAD